MDPDAVFNRYDIRGDHPEEIDEAFAERLGKAVGTHAQEEAWATVVVGRDTRDASEAVYTPLLRGIRSTGADVVDAGVSVTDRTALAATHYGGMSVMVTASHHAWRRTGFKLLYPEGNGFSNEDLDRVEERFRAEAFAEGEGSMLRVQHEFDELYIERMQEVFHSHADALDGVTVVVDAVGGSERTAPLVFEELGATVHAVERDARPEPEPGKDSRADVAAALAEHEADIAVGYDPDADRVYAIHPGEGWLNGDRLFYLLARIVEPDRIVASLDTAPIIEEVDAAVEYTRVGDIFVAAKGMEVDADLLGEPNGHYAVPDFCWYNSGVLASLLLAAHHDHIPAMLDPVRDHATFRHVERFATVAERDEAMNAVMKAVARNYEVLSTEDGVKFSAENVIALARPSATTPKIRLIVHGTDAITEQVDGIRDTLFA